MPIAVDGRVGDHTDLGAIEADASETHRGGDVDAFRETQHALARGAAEQLSRRFERLCFFGTEQRPRRFARRLRHAIEPTDSCRAYGVQATDRARDNPSLRS